MTIALEVNALRKSFGDKVVLDDVSFHVRKGACFGLLGPNGAGKSTTMKILSCVLDADEGDVSVFGMDIRRCARQVRERIGYVPQSITLYEKLSACENLSFFGSMYGVRGAVLRRRIADALERVGLADRAREPVAAYSGGMKRRVNMAAALLHEPQLLILDEPTVGIDPQSRNHIFEVLRLLKREGVTIVYSTHYMEEVEALCDDLAIIDRGKVVVAGELEDVLDRYGTKSVYLEVEGLEQPPQVPSVRSVSRKGRGWLLETEAVLEAVRQLADVCLQRGWTVKQLEIVRPSLETVFLHLTGTSLRDDA